MNRIFSAKTLIATAIALGAIAVGNSAHAGADLSFVIGVNTANRHVQPAPVYVQPAPVVLPAAVYGQPQHAQFGRDRDRDRDRNARFNRNAGRGGAYGDADRDGVPNRYDRNSRFYDARATNRSAQWGDRDRDGVPNWLDHEPRNSPDY